MIYRKLGKTALEVGEIGLGCEGFMGKDLEQTRQLMDIAMNAGVNCMDLYSPNPDMRSNIGFAIKGRRENFILQAHICSVWKKDVYKRQMFILRAFQRGADGVILCGCHPGDCHYTSGNYYARRRMTLLFSMLDYLGIEKERTRVEWVSAAEGAKFAATKMCIRDRCKSILSGVNTVLTVSSMMHGEYGIEDVCLSISTIIGRGGIISRIVSPLNDYEIELLHKSANSLKEVISNIQF